MTRGAKMILDLTCDASDVVEHDGRAYLLVDLVHYLPLALTCEVGEMVTRGPQAFWDTVVRRGPHEADQSVAAVDRDWDFLPKRPPASSDGLLRLL